MLLNVQAPLTFTKYPFNGSNVSALFHLLAELSYSNGPREMLQPLPRLESETDLGTLIVFQPAFKDSSTLSTGSPDSVTVHALYVLNQ